MPSSTIPVLMCFLIVAGLSSLSTLALNWVSIPLDDFKYAIKLCESNHGLAALDAKEGHQRIAYCTNTATFEFNSGDKHE